MNILNNDKLTLHYLVQFFQPIDNWIDDLINQYNAQAKPVSNFSFSRLGSYYPANVLDSTKVVVVNKVPAVPLASFGLNQFKDFENLDAAGITYKNLLFIDSRYANDESVFFHELVHVLQWQYLGAHKFILLYGLGLTNYGYRESPLEEIAYRAQNVFDTNKQPFDVYQSIKGDLEKLDQYVLSLL